VRKEKILSQKIAEAKQAIHKIFKGVPRVGIILGTGLGDIRKRMDVTREIPYDKIPHFPKPTAISHKGQLIFGNFSGVPVVVMEGRFHAYEGCSLEEVTFPVRVMKALGIKSLLISNAAGGLNPLHKKGDIVVIDDHINFMGLNPLVGPNEDKLGIRFPDMSEPYSKKLIQLAEKVAVGQALPLNFRIIHKRLNDLINFLNCVVRQHIKWRRRINL